MPNLRATAAMVEPLASSPSAWRSLRTICSGEYPLPIESPPRSLLGLLDSHRNWTKSQGAGQKNLSAHKAALLLRGVRPRVDPALTRRRLAADLISDVRRLDRGLSDLERHLREAVEKAST